MPPCAVEKGRGGIPLLQLTCLGLLPAMTGISDDVTLSFFCVYNAFGRDVMCAG